MSVLRQSSASTEFNPVQSVVLSIHFLGGLSLSLCLVYMLVCFSLLLLVGE